MQFREPAAELKRLAVNCQRSVRALLAFHGVLGQTVCVDAQEITHTRFLQFQITCHAVKGHHMHDVLLHRSEDPLQHVVEMHAYVRGNTAGLALIAFPRRVVPFAPRSDIRQVHVIHAVFGTLLHLLLQRHNGRVKTQLQDIVRLMACGLFYLQQVVDVIRIEHQRLLADHVAAQSQTVTDIRVVRIVRRANRNPRQRVVRMHLLGAIAVKLLVLREKRAVRERTVQPSHAVEFVHCHHQVVAGVLDGFYMTGRYVACHADKCEVLHVIFNHRG